MDYIDSINELDKKAEKRLANVFSAGNKTKPKKEKKPKKKKDICWACRKKEEYQNKLCSTCYQRVRANTFLKMDLSDFCWDEEKNMNDWSKVAELYHEFFQVSDRIGLTPQLLLAKLMQGVAANEIKEDWLRGMYGEHE